jgi:tetratricopeptide (TPR) repeat protein
MKKIFTISVIILSLAVVFGGCASKRYTKKGQKLEAVGQFSEAADMFYQAVTVKKTNIEAVAGLKRTGQMTLSKKLSLFNQAYNNQNNKEAVYYYQDAKAYYNKLNAVGADLNFPSFYDEYYNEVKDLYLEDKYYEGSNLLDSEKFAEAEKVFREIVKLQENYKDSKDKLTTSVNEPKYRDGLRLMDSDQFRKAYYVFDGIVKNAGVYKSAFDLRKECQEKGTISIAIAPITNKTSTSGLDSDLQSRIINGIQSSGNPFIKLIDFSTVSGTNSSMTSKPTNAQAVLYVEITKFTYNKGNNEETDKRGYLRKTVKVLNRETNEYENKTQYDKVSYKEYKMSRTVDFGYNYKLVNLRSGEIYTSSSKSVLSRDDIHYARYTGDSKNLVPGYWKDLKNDSPEDHINDNKQAIDALNSLLNSRSQIKDYNTLSTEVVTSAASVVSSAVNDFINQN